MEVTSCTLAPHGTVSWHGSKNVCMIKISCPQMPSGFCGAKYDGRRRILDLERGLLWPHVGDSP